jgi:hypothetical protein
MVLYAYFSETLSRNLGYVVYRQISTGKEIVATGVSRDPSLKWLSYLEDVVELGPVDDFVRRIPAGGHPSHHKTASEIKHK